MLGRPRYHTSCYVAIVTTPLWYSTKADVEIEDREDDPEMNPYGYSHLVFDKSVKKKKKYTEEKTATLENWIPYIEWN